MEKSFQACMITKNKKEPNQRAAHEKHFQEHLQKISTNINLSEYY